MAGELRRQMEQLSDWCLEAFIEGLPREQRNDPTLMLPALQRVGAALRLMGPQVRSNRTCVLAAVEQHGVAFRYADPELQQDPDVQKLNIEHSHVAVRRPAELTREAKILAVTKGVPLDKLTDSDRGDLEIVTAAVQRDGMELNFAAPHLKEDLHLARTAVQQNPAAIYVVPKALRGDPTIAEAIAPLKAHWMDQIGERPGFLRGVAPAWVQEDEDVLLAAIKLHCIPEDSSMEAGAKLAAICENVSGSLGFSAEVVSVELVEMLLGHGSYQALVSKSLAEVEADGLRFSELPPPLRGERSLLCAAIQTQPNAYRCASAALKKDPDVFLQALELHNKRMDSEAENQKADDERRLRAEYPDARVEDSMWLANKLAGSEREPMWDYDPLDLVENGDMSEIKTMSKPPKVLSDVLAITLCLGGFIDDFVDMTWPQLRRHMGNVLEFLKTLRETDAAWTIFARNKIIERFGEGLPDHTDDLLDRVSSGGLLFLQWSQATMSSAASSQGVLWRCHDRACGRAREAPQESSLLASTSSELQNNRLVVSRAVEYDGRAFAFASDALREDLDLIALALRTGGQRVRSMVASEIWNDCEDELQAALRKEMQVLTLHLEDAVVVATALSGAEKARVCIAADDRLVTFRSVLADAIGCYPTGLQLVSSSGKKLDIFTQADQFMMDLLKGS